MVRSNTDAVVTLVENPQSVRYWAKVDIPRNPMGEYVPPRDAESPVSVLGRRIRPNPAASQFGAVILNRAVLVYLQPESRENRAVNLTLDGAVLRLPFHFATCIAMTICTPLRVSPSCTIDGLATPDDSSVTRDPWYASIASRRYVLLSAQV